MDFPGRLGALLGKLGRLGAHSALGFARLPFVELIGCVFQRVHAEISRVRKALELFAEIACAAGVGGFIHGVREFPGHTAHLGRHLAQGLEHHRQVLWTHDNQRNNADEDQLTPAHGRRSRS